MTEPGTATTFTAADDGFHALGDRWWETETAWFSFHVPERRLGGWLYTMVRPNIGTVAGGAWVWDDSAELPWEVRYSTNYSALQLPPDADLRDIVLPTGVHIRVVEPTMVYDLGYDDPGRLTLALRFTGVMAPEPLTAVGSTFGSAHHFDQLGRVTGEVVLDGTDRIAVDCLGMRDRTWGPRPEHRPRRAAYVTGAIDDGHAFLAVTNTRPDGADPIAYGFLRRDGRTLALESGERLVERDPRGHVRQVTIVATDVEGRALQAVGEPVSRIIVNRHSFVDLNSLLRWDIGGGIGWGEDQDMWPVHEFAATRRAGGFTATP